MTMRKYEQGGGVVLMEWQRGDVPIGSQYGAVLREVWELKWGWDGMPRVTARIGAYTWDDAAQAWVPLHGGATGRVVRWVRIGVSRQTDIPLTLKEW